LLDGFALDVKVSYDRRWMFHPFSGSSILVFTSSGMIFALPACHKSTSLKSVPYVMFSTKGLNVLATLDIVTTRIGPRANASAGNRCGGVFWISMKGLATELCRRNGYDSCSSLIILGNLFFTIFTHPLRVSPYKIDSGNPITTISVCRLHIIAADTEVKVMPRPNSSATSASGVSEFLTNLRTCNHFVKTWCARNLVPGRPGIGFF